MKDYAAIATGYAQDVAAGRIVACQSVRLACERHLRDLAKAEAGWDYAWNPELVDASGKAYRPADRICRFAELMYHVKGDWAGRGERIKLEAWQVFILASIFGWIVIATGKRRFRSADVCVPRKNAKSTLAAVVGNYMLAVDGEFGAEVYSGATSQKQAYEVFKPALLMARMNAEFRSRYGVTPNVSNMAITETNSKFEPIIGRPGDGASPSCSIVDEYHEHRTSELYDTMITGMGARSQPLMLMITTAGDDIGGPCYQHLEELQKILQGVTENERRFGVIYGIDEGDDWTSEDALKKANPNFGISVDRDFLLGAQQDAMVDPRKQNVFKTKHLNVWVNAQSPWLNLLNLQKAGDPSLKLADFAGDPCWIGLDLASTKDIASAVWLFKRGNGDDAEYYAFSRNYVPQAAVENPDNQHYHGWVKQGTLIATPGNMIAIAQIKDDILASASQCLISEVCIDQWGSAAINADLAEEGFQVIDIPMNAKYLSQPMKLIDGLVDAGRFHHDGSLPFVWMLSNVEVFEDRNENIFPRKARAEKKIDAAVALIVAMSRAMYGAGGGSIYDERGLVAV